MDNTLYQVTSIEFSRRCIVMSFKSDIEIAQEAVAEDIRDIAKKIRNFVTVLTDRY